jgi:hypothetical protein
VVQGLQILNFSGVGLRAGSNSLIGGYGPGEANIIGGGGDGILLGNRVGSANIIGNYIGTDESGSVAMGNLGTAITLWFWCEDNHFEGNTVAYNGGHGIMLEESWPGGPVPVRNSFTRNSIFSNGGEGISFAAAGANEDIQPPVIVSADVAAGIVEGTACAGCVVEVFSDWEDEGRVFEGEAYENGEGDWFFAKGTSLTGPNVTATATDSAGNTSEFSLAVGPTTSEEWVEAFITAVEDLVGDGVLDQGNGNALTSKLENALEKLDKGNTGAACNQLGAFVNQVEAFVNAGKLTEVQGQLLIDAANALIEQLCGGA